MGPRPVEERGGSGRGIYHSKAAAATISYKECQLRVNGQRKLGCNAQGRKAAPATKSRACFFFQFGLQKEIASREQALLLLEHEGETFLV